MIGRLLWRITDGAERRWLIGLVAIAFALRLIAIAALPSPAITVSESGRTAANLVSGKGYTFDFYGYRTENPLHSFMPPLYTLLLAGVMRATPTHAGAALKLIQAVLSSLNVWLVYSIGILSFDSATAIWAALAMTLYPVNLVVVTQPTITTVNIFLICLLIWALLRVREDSSWAWIAASGFVWGLNVLNRPLILAFGLGIALWCFLGRRQLHRNWLLLAGGITTAMLITVAPWTLRNLSIHHALVPVSTNGGFTFWNGNNPFTTGSGFDVRRAQAEDYVGQAYAGQPYAGENGSPIVVWEPYPLPREIAGRVADMDEIALERALYTAGLAFIREHPSDWLRLEGMKFVALWWFRPHIGTYRDFYRPVWVRPYQVVYALLLVLLIGGLGITRHRWRSLSLFYLLFAYVTASFCAFNVITRYRWEFEPLIMLFAAAAVARLIGIMTPPEAV